MVLRKGGCGCAGGHALGARLTEGRRNPANAKGLKDDWRPECALNVESSLLKPIASRTSCPLQYRTIGQTLPLSNQYGSRPPQRDGGPRLVDAALAPNVSPRRAPSSRPQCRRRTVEIIRQSVGTSHPTKQLISCFTSAISRFCRCWRQIPFQLVVLAAR
jgi:hypothetical protein